MPCRGGTLWSVLADRLIQGLSGEIPCTSVRPDGAHLYRVEARMRKFAVLIPTLLIVLVASPLSAQEVTCDDVAFDEQAMTAYPMVRSACLDVIEHEGARYAHLEALVRQAGPPSMLVVFKHRDGTWGPATRLTPPPDFKAYLGGEMVNAVDVPAGSEMGIYLPEGRWEIAMSDADQLMIAEAEFAPLGLEVTAEELPEEGMPPEVEETTPADAPAEAAAEAADQAADEAAPAEDDQMSEWYWILGLAFAFIVVWLLLRKRKAQRDE